MTTLKIRQKVFDYINNADERILKAVYAMLKEYEDTPGGKSALSEKQYEIIEKRWKNHKSGKSKSYTIEEVKHRLHR
jgi:hypothetical protein